MSNKENLPIHTSIVLRFINKLKPIYRFALSLFFTIIVAFSLAGKLDPILVTMLCWIAFSIIYLGISWLILFYRPVKEIQKHANIDDGSKTFVFFMVIISSLAGMMMVLLFMLSDIAKEGNTFVFITVAISGMLLSWVMVHTLFTFHYAHLFYIHQSAGNNNAEEGLVFPEEKNPDYIDFAYFSFVIGCTFQVSDVTISSRKMRRVVLFHGLLSFALNTFVVALTINLIAGLSQ